MKNTLAKFLLLSNLIVVSACARTTSTSFTTSNSSKSKTTSASTKESSITSNTTSKSSNNTSDKPNTTTSIEPYDSEMPGIHINTKNGIAIDDKSLIDPTQKKGKDKEIPVYNYVDANISVTNTEEKYALDNALGKVKVRGNYTSTYKKKPIRIKFEEKHNMLGLNSDHKFKSWVLLAEWKDSSLMRNAISNYLGKSLVKDAGYYCTDFAYAKVYLNEKYNGVYLLVEQQQIDSNRVNIPESKKEEDGVNTGYLLELDGYYTNEPEIQRFTINYSGLKALTNGFTVTNDIMNQNQHDYIAKYTQSVWNVVYDACKKVHSNLDSSPYHTVDETGSYVVDRTITSAEEAVGKVIDINSLINMYILQEVCEDRDVGWSSFYFSIDLSEQGNRLLTFNAPWDFDYSLGNNIYSNAMKASLNEQQKMIEDGRLISRGGFNSFKFSSDAILTSNDFKFTNNKALYLKNGENVWFTVFAEQNWFWNRIYERWSDVYQKGLFKNASSLIDAFNAKYEKDFEENFVKWPESMGLKIDTYAPEINTYFATQKQSSQYLKAWLDARVSGLNSALQEEKSKH